MRYERIRVKGKTIYLSITAENGHFLRGLEVDRYGDEVTGRNFDERIHLIDKLAITKRTQMKMNPVYAELEEV